MTNSHGSATNTRRVIGLLAGILAGLAVMRLLRRRRAVGERPPGTAADPRAEELRRKLAGAREPGEPAISSPGPEVDSEAEADEARRRVHDEARDAIEEMHRSGESP